MIFFRCAMLLAGLWSAASIAQTSFVNTQGGEAQSAETEADELLANAWRLETAADYRGAATAYQQYLASRPPKSAERRHARIKLPVLQEAATHGASDALDLFLSALNSRAANDIDGATALLDRILNEYPSSRLVDDALYLRAYIAMMNNFNFQLAHDSLQSLRFSYPQSRYYDTALYSEAIAQEQLGNRQLAIDKLYELRARHTGVSLATLAWPRDEYTSRLWFERSQRRLEYLLNQQQNASTLVSMEPHGEDGYAWRATVSVEGQDMTLVLNRSQLTANTTVKNADGSDRFVISGNAFSGQVEGDPASWARVTFADNAMRGVVSVNGRKIPVITDKTGGTLSDFHPLLLGDIDGHESAEPDHVLHPPKDENEFDLYTRSVRQVTGTTLLSGTVGYVAPIGVVIDSKYNDYHGGRGIEEALSILNITDGVFREQLGLAISVETIIVIDDQQNDPMNLGSVSMETMMRNFRDYRLESTELGSDIGLATLFSGNKNNDSALGLAWIGAACRTDGYDVSVVTPYKLSGLLSTHEIGHTLGAPHDSDTSCSNQTTKIMWPYLSDSTDSSFSSCSKDAVTELVGINGNCLIEALDVEVTLDVTTDTIRISVVNLDNTRSTSGAQVTVTSEKLAGASYPGVCTAGTDQLNCNIGVLGPGLSQQLQIDLSNPLNDENIVTATARPVGYMDVITGNNSVSNDINGNVLYFSDTGINNNSGTVPSGNVAGFTRSAKVSGGGQLSASGVLSLAMLLFICASRRRYHLR